MRQSFCEDGQTTQGDGLSCCCREDNEISLFLSPYYVGAIHAAEETELKDNAGRTIIRYVVEAPQNIAPAGTTDRRSRWGCSSAFRSTTGPPATNCCPFARLCSALG